MKAGENPENDPRTVKFLAGSDGYRGILLATSDHRKKGIVLGLNGDTWGKLYLVVERQTGVWPWAEKQVDVIPNTKEWHIELPGD